MPVAPTSVIQDSESITIMQNNGIQPRQPWRFELVAQLLVLAAIFMPELAHAQVADLGGLAQVGGFLKSIVNLVIFEWGYYIAILALAITFGLLFRGHLSLGAALWCCVGIIGFFFSPSIVSSIKNLARSFLQ
jgi:type IV secretion system protein VirB2